MQRRQFCSTNCKLLFPTGARRKNNILQSMVFLYIPGVGLLRHQNHPETAMKQTDDDQEGWSGGGVSLIPVEPMKSWKVKFQAKISSTEKLSST